MLAFESIFWLWLFVRTWTNQKCQQKQLIIILRRKYLDEKICFFQI